MNWIALPDDFASRVNELIVRKHPRLTISRADVARYTWSERGIGYAMMTVTPTDNHVKVTFMTPPGGAKSMPEHVFPYAEGSLKSVAQAICDWIDEFRAS
jgi:hypothetical protein